QMYKSSVWAAMAVVALHASTAQAQTKWTYEACAAKCSWAVSSGAFTEPLTVPACIDRIPCSQFPHASTLSNTQGRAPGVPGLCEKNCEASWSSAEACIQGLCPQFHRR